MVPRHLEFGLLGEHLAHSFSPAIHRQLGDYDYQLVELSPEQVGPFPVSYTHLTLPTTPSV